MHNIFVLINVLIFIQLNLVINELRWVISSDSLKLTLFSHNNSFKLDIIKITQILYFKEVQESLWILHKVQL